MLDVSYLMATVRPAIFIGAIFFVSDKKCNGLNVRLTAGQKYLEGTILNLPVSIDARFLLC